ncbi:hypothetical protein BH23ACT12_BH23ACT12_11040 [soil metagenome]
MNHRAVESINQIDDAVYEAGRLSPRLPCRSSVGLEDKAVSSNFTTLRVVQYISVLTYGA